MKLKTFCSLTMIPTLILILLLLSSLDNYSIPTDTYGQPIDDASLNQSNTDSVLVNDSSANSSTAINGTVVE